MWKGQVAEEGDRTHRGIHDGAPQREGVWGRDDGLCAPPGEAGVIADRPVHALPLSPLKPLSHTLHSHTTALHWASWLGSKA